MDDISQLKSVLRSLVVSSPNEMDMRALLKDYRNMMGEAMPIRKFGYKEPLAFLTERCNDCFVFSGNPSNPVLTLIVPETLKHIDEFVQRQKRPTNAKKKRQSIPGSVIKSPKTNLIVESYSCKKKQNLKNKTEPKTKPPDTNKTASVATPVVNGLSQEKSYQTDFDNEETKKSIIDINEATSTNGSSTALQNFLKKRTAAYDNNNCDSYKLDDNKSTKDDVDSGRQTSSSNCSWKGAKFEQLKAEIAELISENPEGVWCTDLMELYRKRYSKELDYGRLGYTSIVSALYGMSDVVALSRLHDTGDWLARHPAAPPPPPPPRARRPRAPRAPPHVPVDPDDALPGIAYDPDVFPEDCMNFSDSLPPPPMEDIVAGTLLEVMVGEVYSPSHLWLIRLGEQHHIAMEDMMDEMTEYYERGEGRSRVLALGTARVGQACACVYEGDWHRAVVVRVLDAELVKVRLVDYGTVEQTAWRALRPLRRRGAALPAQALRARLAGVAPRALHWPRAAAHHLLRRVHCKHLVAHVAALHPQDKILEVFLVDTSGDEDLCLADDMINSGHAERRQYSSLQMSECYLYPRFEALETGATPNFGEIEVYLRHGIELQYVEDYRRHVPAVLPEDAQPAAPDTPPRSPTPSPPPSPQPSPPYSPPHSPPRSPPQSAHYSPPPAFAPPATEAPFTRIPLLPVGAGAGGVDVGGVRLTLAECDTYRRLCASSPMAAHMFMVNAISRALSSTSLSHPAHPAHPAPHQPPASYMPPISMIRPPPGFDSL